MKEPPKSQDTIADLNGYIDAHKSPSVESPVNRVSVRRHTRSVLCFAPEPEPNEREALEFSRLSILLPSFSS